MEVMNMGLVNIHIEMNKEQIEKYIKEQLEIEQRQLLLFWDVTEMMRQTCMSKSFLENEFLQDPRMKLLERRKEKGKRYWFYKESVEVLHEIMNEW